MNYIFFNEDGSIKKTNFTDSIQQNDDGSDKIFISIDGIDYNDFSAVGVFVLPDGTVSEEGADFESDYEYASGETADGFVVTLTINETKLSGVVFLTLQIIENETNVAKYTYRVAITVNKSASLTSLTLINLAQYNALKSYIDSNYLKRTYTFYSDTLLSTIISAVGEEVPFIFKYSYDNRKYLVDYKMVGSSNIQRIKLISLQENKCYFKKNFAVSGVTLANLIDSTNELETADKAWVSDNTVGKLYRHTITINTLQWGGHNYSLYPGQRNCFVFYSTKEDAYTLWSDVKDEVDALVPFVANFGTANQIITNLNLHATGYGTVHILDMTTGEDVIPVQYIQNISFDDSVKEV